MDPNLVSATLSNEDQQAILASLNTILQKMPFLIDLTIKQRSTLPKAADKTEAFVRKAVEVATHHEILFSADFMQEMQKDANLLDAIAPIRVAIDALQKKIDDTTLQLNAEAFAAARTVYAATKTPYGNPVLRDASADLGKRFSRSKQNPAADTSTSAGTTSTDVSPQPAPAQPVPAQATAVPATPAAAPSHSA